MEIQEGSITFSSVKGYGPQKCQQIVYFQNKVKKATAVLKGIKYGFSEGYDRHFGSAQINLRVANIAGTMVTVEGELGVRDWSGDWDDPYEGTIYFAVLADLEEGPTDATYNNLKVNRDLNVDGNINLKGNIIM